MINKPPVNNPYLPPPTEPGAIKYSLIEAASVTPLGINKPRGNNHHYGQGANFVQRWVLPFARQDPGGLRVANGRPMVRTDQLYSPGGSFTKTGGAGLLIRSRAYSSLNVIEKVFQTGSNSRHTKRSEVFFPSTYVGGFLFSWP